MIKLNYYFSVVVLAALVLVCTKQSFSDLPDTTTQNNSKSQDQWYQIYPVNQISLRSYYLSTNHPFAKYILFNSDGDFIKRDISTFVDMDGGADALNNFQFRYKIQMNNVEKVSLKRLYFKYRTDAISLTLGVDTVWMGHGYHGSLLHSTNATPYALLKFRTEKSFRIPYIGKFDYMIFHGWPKKFKILGQRLSWKPIDILEFGVNQTVVYNHNYKIWEYFKVMTATDENVPGSKYDNDQRGSLDIALYMPFLKYIPMLENGKIYFEYAGEDIIAVWQKKTPITKFDGIWYGPFGFDFLDIGNTFGLFLAAKQTSLRIEYSRNYISYPLFFDVYGKKYGGNYRPTRKWYKLPRNVGFTNDGIVMGHHMGPMADDLYFEITHKFNEIKLKLFYDKERHGLVIAPTQYIQIQVDPNPEIVEQYGMELNYRFLKYNFSSTFLLNNYRNVDYNPDPLYGVDIRVGSKAKDYIVGLTVSYLFND
jgi:hypothetical protein